MINQNLKRRLWKKKLNTSCWKENPLMLLCNTRRKWILDVLLVRSLNYKSVNLPKPSASMTKSLLKIVCRNVDKELMMELLLTMEEVVMANVTVLNLRRRMRKLQNWKKISTKINLSLTRNAKSIRQHLSRNLLKRKTFFLDVIPS